MQILNLEQLFEGDCDIYSSTFNPPHVKMQILYIVDWYAVTTGIDTWYPTQCKYANHFTRKLQINIKLKIYWRHSSNNYKNYVKKNIFFYRQLTNMEYILKNEKRDTILKHCKSNILAFMHSCAKINISICQKISIFLKNTFKSKLCKSK